MNKYLILSLFLALAACTVGPDYKRPDFVNDEQIAQSLKLDSSKKTEINKEWYKDFQDQTLNSLITTSLASAPNAKMAVARLRQARAALKINAVKDLPMIDADGSYHYSKVGKNSGYPISTDYYQAGLDASWELDIWGANRRLTESSAALYKSAAADIDSVNLALTAEVANNYINLRTAQEQVRISEQNLKLQESIYDIVNSKFEAGLADESALNQAKFAVETTRSQIPMYQYNVEAYQNALAVLAGELPGAFNERLQSEPKNLVRRRFKLNLNKLYEMPTNVVRLRPDVRIAEYQLISKNAQIGQAVAEFYPNLSLSGFLGFQSGKVSNLFTDNSFAYNYVPALSLPVLRWGELTNNVELKKASAEESIYQYQNTLLSAASEIKNAYTGIAKEYEKNQASRNAVLAQKQVLDLTLERYREGLVDFNNVLTAEQNLLASQNNFVDSNGAVYQNIITFYKSIGGGYRENAYEKIQCLGQLGDDGQCVM